jgi:two-component system nitrogen regulation sensor histidine kinase NtrY
VSRQDDISSTPTLARGADWLRGASRLLVNAWSRFCRRGRTGAETPAVARISSAAASSLSQARDGLRASIAAGAAAAASRLSRALEKPAWTAPPEEKLETEVLQQPKGPAFYIGLAVVILALISGIATYLILTGLTPIVPGNTVVRSLLFTDIVLVASLLAVVAGQVWQLWRARLKGAAGARLHVQIVGLFSVIAVLPALILVVFASASLNRALDHLFSRETENIVLHSIAVAKAYLEEHGQVIRSDIVPMANDLDERATLFRTDPDKFAQAMFQQAQLRNLAGAFLIDSTGIVLSAPDLDLAYSPPPIKLIQQAQSGDVVIVKPHDGLDQVGAVKRLANLPDAYLFVVREVNGNVIAQERDAEQSAEEYWQLQQRRTGVQAAYGLMYLEIALTLLLSAIWTGMWFANILVAPIRRLIGAAELVSKGNLGVEVPVRASHGDLGNLAMTFNTMTVELRKQRDHIMNANRQLSERGRFIEAVLSGVSAGVIGLDAAGRVTLANRSALQLLGKAEGDLEDRQIGEVLPELAFLVDKARNQSRGDRPRAQVDLTVAGAERHFAVQVTRERSGDHDFGFVVTIDDVTGLVAAQRTSAWADVARRIAHEIKNPLTPIQLSAERLKRKYGSVITEDRDVFDRCTDTIIRQVGDLGRMVDEFSSFARMPRPQLEPQDLGAIVRQAVDLFQIARPDITFRVEVPAEPVEMSCDRRLLSQAVTNLIKNATEGIGAMRDTKYAPPGYQGLIEATVALADGKAVISIIDNGCGLPKKDRGRLIEPYVTTRAKGTGIGLAVVHRVTEQHGGVLLLEDAPITDQRRQGAAVRMVLPMTIASADAAPTEVA